jgi:hypothetical protein
MRKVSAFLIISCALSFSQNVRVDGIVSSRSGLPAPGALVAVCTQPAVTTTTPCSPLATLCSSLTDTTCTAANPVTADGLGNYSFYIASSAQNYTLQFSGPGLITKIQPDQAYGPSTRGTFFYPNSATGTFCNQLAKMDPLAGATTFGKATVTLGGEVPPDILGVVASGCGFSGNATIVSNGYVQVMFDAAPVTVGDAIGVSSTPGLVTDLGSRNPTSGTPIGQVALSPTGGVPSGCNAGCYVNFQMGSGGGGAGQTNAVITNPATTGTNTITPTAAAAQPITLNCPSGAASNLPCLQALDNTGAQVLAAQQNGQVALGKSGNAKSIGSGVSANSDLNGSLTMSGGTATYTWTGTYTTHPTCIASDETSIAAVKITYTGVTSVTFTTSGGSDVIDYACFARN